MPKGRTTKHPAVILQPDEGWLADQPPVEETEDRNCDDGQERKDQQAKKAGQQERIRLEGEFRTRPKPAASLHRAWLSDGRGTCSALVNVGYIPSEFLHMPELLNESEHASGEIPTI